MTDNTKERLTRALLATLAALAPAFVIGWFLVILFIVKALS